MLYANFDLPLAEKRLTDFSGHCGARRVDQTADQLDDYILDDQLEDSIDVTFFDTLPTPMDEEKPFPCQSAVAYQRPPTTEAEHDTEIIDDYLRQFSDQFASKSSSDLTETCRATSQRAKVSPQVAPVIPLTANICEDTSEEMTLDEICNQHIGSMILSQPSAQANFEPPPTSLSELVELMPLSTPLPAHLPTVINDHLYSQPPLTVVLPQSVESSYQSSPLTIVQLQSVESSYQSSQRSSSPAASISSYAGSSTETKDDSLMDVIASLKLLHAETNLVTSRPNSLPKRLRGRQSKVHFSKKQKVSDMVREEEFLQEENKKLRRRADAMLATKDKLKAYLTNILESSRCT